MKLNRTVRLSSLRSSAALSIFLLTGVVCASWAQDLPVVARATNALNGSKFAARLDSLSLAQREQEIFNQVRSGNVPDFLRKLSPIAVTNVSGGATNIATFHAAPDYLAIGSDDDYFLMPVSPDTAQKIADALNCSLPTPKMVDAIYAAAEVKLPPQPIPPTPAMTTVPVFSNHNALVRAQRAEQLTAHPLGALVAGDKKDVVISARLTNAAGKVAIYGWHQTNGVPIQPLYLGHTAAWVDYSHGIRLIQQRMVVNGRAITVKEVLGDPALAPLLSDEGVLSQPRYANENRPPSSAQARARASEQTQAVSTNQFGERNTLFTIDPDVKVVINSPAQFPQRALRKPLLILYALPNGNTIEQTIGRKLKAGDDWHYDIQHIGAQTRFLRELLPDLAISVAYLEAKQKSWPAWRKQHGNNMIPEIVSIVARTAQSANPAPAPDNARFEIVLSGHSGGGSFIFGYLNAVENIPPEIVRIAFLDSSYAYDRGLCHNEKLVRWVKRGEGHFLCVLAYDDANALLDGKPFVSAAGGTWGTSHAMQRDLAEDFPFTSVTNAAGLQTFSALGGRVQLLLKENPERKVLHTVQVERNGFIHSLLSGTTNESGGYEYFGPRAYSRWIEP